MMIALLFVACIPFPPPPGLPSGDSDSELGDSDSEEPCTALVTAGVNDPLLGATAALSCNRFVMGSPESEPDRSSDEVQHEVQLSPFWIMKREVTQGMWKEVFAGDNPSTFATCGDDCPVESVSWCDAVWFANKLSEQRGLEAAYGLPGDWVIGGEDCEEFSAQVVLNMDAVGFRLPTEAEWEFAARGGESYIYSGSSVAEDVAWYVDNSDGRTHPTCDSSKERNGYGLCDMSGNVWEWTWDWSGSYPEGPVQDPVGESTGVLRVNRGGGWYNSAAWMRVASRLGRWPGFRDNGLGFRLSGSLATDN